MNRLFTYALMLGSDPGAGGDGATNQAVGCTSESLVGMLPTLGFLVLMFGVLYFFMIRPQKKKEKAVKAMLDALKVGDRVLTIGGIYGTVTGVKDDQVIIAVGAQKNVMNMARWAIKSVEDSPLENDKSPEI